MITSSCRLALFLSAMMTLSACLGSGGGGPPALELPPDGGPDMPDMDRSGIDRPAFSLLVNDARGGAGLVRLQESTPLSDASALHAADMEAHGYFSHTGRDGSSVGDRARDAGYEWSWIAENIARGFDGEGEVFEAWMASAGHEANVMNSKALEFGIGRDGDTWVLVLGAPR